MTIHLSEVRNGDTITIEKTVLEKKTFVVTSKGNYTVSDGKSPVFNITADDPYGREGWVIKSVKHPEPKKPEHWPSQVGDVWRGESGKEYHRLGGKYSSTVVQDFWTSDNNHTTAEEVLKDSPKLAYRKGNYL